MSDMVPVIVPRLGLSVTEVTFTEWLFKAGQRVSEGEAICLVESDKTQLEIEAPATGVLQPAAEEDEVFKVGASIGAIQVG